MADASPTSPGDGADRGWSGPSRRRRHAAGHEGHRCSMCRRTVVVDDRGRCPLGHQVVPVSVIEQRSEDRQLIATYIEPVTADPSPAPPADAPSAPADRTVFEDPPPPLPSGSGGAPSDVNPRPALPVRSRGPASPEPVASLFRRTGGTPPTSTPQAAPESVLAEWLDHGSGRSPDGRAVVPLTDLTPDAPSALDLEAAPAAAPIAVRDAVFEQEPLTDPGLEPPRGVLQMVAGAVFVAVLVAIAWYLATAL